MTETTFDVGRIPPQLRESLLHGKAAAEIGWGRDGDFDSCVRFLERHGVPARMRDGECAELHKEATGFWPGKGREHSCDSEEFAEMATFQALIASAAPDNDQRIRWEGPLAPIGTPTGDGRLFPAGKISYQSFPQPFGWQEKSGMGHQGAVTVGVIEHAEEGMWEGKPHIIGRGYFLDPNIIPEVNKALHLIEHGVAGPSVDLDSFSAALSDHGGEKVAAVKKGRMRAATLVRIPAFADLRLKLKYPEGHNRPFDLAPEAGATFAVNPHGWKSAPIAPREALFDADDAVSRIEAWADGDPEKMASAFLWIADTENAPLLGRKGYRLPWADIIDDKPYIIYHAIYAAAALLEGGHGGLPNIPEEEKAKLRGIISEIYAKLAEHYGDPHMRASWDPPRNQNTAAAEDVEEFLGRYTESKHPRDPRHDKHAGEWVDVPDHGPHGQIKVGGKWVYPDKKTGKVPGHREQSEHTAPKVKATVKKAAPKRTEPEEKKVVARHEAERQGHETRAAKHPKDLTDAELEQDREHHENKSAQHARAAQVAKKNQRHEEAKSQQAKSDAAYERVKAVEAEKARRSKGEAETGGKHPLTHEGVIAAHRDSSGHGSGDSKLVSLVQIRHRLGGTHEEQTALLKQLDRERKIQLEPEPNQKVLTPEIRSAGVPVGSKNMLYLAVLKHPEKKEEAPKTPGPKVKVTVKKAAPGHKLTPAQEKYLKEGGGHPASKKVLQREGYLDEQGNLTQKGRDAGGVEPAGEKKVAKVTVKKTAAHKVTESQRNTLRNLHTGGPLADGAKREGVHPASLKVLEREGYVKRDGNNWDLTPKGRNEIDVHVGSVPGHRVEKPPAKVKIVRDTGKIAEQVKNLKSEKELGSVLDGLSRAELVDVAKKVGAPHKAGATKPEIKSAIHYQVQVRVGSDVLLGRSSAGQSKYRANSEKLAKLRAERDQLRREFDELSKRKDKRYDDLHRAQLRGEDSREIQADISRMNEEVIQKGNAARALDAQIQAMLPNPDVISSSWKTELRQETGIDDPVPVRNLAIQSSEGAYEVHHGFAYKIGDRRYLVEGRDKAEARRVVEQIRTLEAELGPSASSMVRSAAWLLGRNPEDEYWQKRFNSDHLSAAMNDGRGNTTFWARSIIKNPIERLRETFHHEIGHTASVEASKRSLGSESTAWGMAAKHDAARPQLRASLSRHGHQVTTQPDHRREWAHGVSSYGKSSAEEDFAESVSQYLAGVLGSAEYVDAKGRIGRKPILFRDLFPERAKILDKLFPEVASKQKEQLLARFSSGEKWVVVPR